MKKILKRPASGGMVKRRKTRLGPGPDVRSRRARARSIAPETPAERLDMAFLAALMYLPDQAARSLASDALVRHGPGAEDPRRAARKIVEAGMRENWQDWRSLGVLADYAGIDVKTCSGTSRVRR